MVLDTLRGRNIDHHVVAFESGSAVGASAHFLNPLRGRKFQSAGVSLVARSRFIAPCEVFDAGQGVWPFPDRAGRRLPVLCAIGQCQPPVPSPPLPLPFPLLWSLRARRVVDRQLKFELEVGSSVSLPVDGFVSRSWRRQSGAGTGWRRSGRPMT